MNALNGIPVANPRLYCNLNIFSLFLSRVRVFRRKTIFSKQSHYWSFCSNSFSFKNFSLFSILLFLFISQFLCFSITRRVQIMKACIHAIQEWGGPLITQTVKLMPLHVSKESIYFISHSSHIVNDDFCHNVLNWPQSSYLDYIRYTIFQIYKQ